MRAVALLRGINVGGKNRLPMADLRAALEDSGFERVETYIQSGNVVFESGLARAELEPAIEEVLAERLELPVLVMVRSHRQFSNVVASAPEGFGSDPERLSDVVFLRAPLTVPQAMRAMSLRDGVDRVWPGPGVLYFDRLRARATESRLSRLASAPAYQRMTIRNWATTTKLLAMLDARRG